MSPRHEQARIRFPCVPSVGPTNVQGPLPVRSVPGQPRALQPPPGSELEERCAASTLNMHRRLVRRPIHLCGPSPRFWGRSGPLVLVCMGELWHGQSQGMTTRRQRHDRACVCWQTHVRCGGCFVSMHVPSGGPECERAGFHQPSTMSTPVSGAKLVSRAYQCSGPTPCLYTRAGAHVRTLYICKGARPQPSSFCGTEALPHQGQGLASSLWGLNRIRDLMHPRHQPRATARMHQAASSKGNMPFRNVPGGVGCCRPNGPLGRARAPMGSVSLSFWCSKMANFGHALGVTGHRS